MQVSIKILFITILSTVFLTGCSSKDSSSSANLSSSINSNNPADQHFFSITFCNISSDISINAAGDANPDSSVALQADAQSMTNPGVEVDCESEDDKALPGPGAGETGTGSLTYSNSETALTAAAIHFEPIGGLQELESTLILHDGDTRFSRVSGSNESNEFGPQTTTRITMGVYNATIAFGATLIQTNTDVLTAGSFEVIAPDESTEAGATNIALLSFLAQDKNSDGTISEEESEVVSSISGNINVSGVSPDWSVTLDVTLEDGTTLTGVYNGSLHVIP